MRKDVMEIEMSMKQMVKKSAFALMAIVMGLSAVPVQAAQLPDTSSLRPPSVPLVAVDPYFSIWSASDTLTGDVTRHWTGRPQPLTSLIRVDGKTFRLMGNQPKDIEAMKQVSLNVLPTQTIYTFEGAGIRAEVTFLQAALPDDIDLMSQPITHLVWNAVSTDGKSHDVSVYVDAGMELVVNDNGQAVVWSKETVGGLDALKAGTQAQNVLGRKGDDVRIDWGYFYLAASKQAKSKSVIAAAKDSRQGFSQGNLPAAMDSRMPRKVSDDTPVMAMQLDLGKVGKSAKSTRVLLAYDDIDAILYFGKPLKAYWKRDGKTIDQIVKAADKDFASLVKRCSAFDIELMQDLYNAGGADYQKIGALAYRQALAANKIAADKTGMPLMFSKENFSNGCMGTVDVFYPFAPQVLLLNPTLAKASFVPILEYGRSERWRFPFAPHDIGTYPHALGQAYGGGERSERDQMPVEECGNMILLVAAVVEAENDIEFARTYWDVLSVWADYLKSKGLDPENQLCTDDFAGHMAHNVNLSVKAIVALGAYAKMADMMGEKDTAAAFRQTAEQYTKQWMQMADDGDHYRLAFDKSGTWSQKYNLIWDRLLKLNLFPASVAEKEMAYYRKIQKAYGLPLDNRSDYTKLDWIVWTASITGKQDDFEALIAPIVRFLNETPDRVPMTDWYWTHNARHRGFQARPVVGGVFIRLMDDPAVWSKWVKKADRARGQWSSLPKPPKVITVVPSSMEKPLQWAYTFDKPAEDWFKPSFNAKAAGWKRGPAGFGTDGTPGAVMRTKWSSSDIWVRRSFELKEVPSDLFLMAHHDEDAEVYVNGVLIANLLGFTSDYTPYKLSEKALGALKPGRNVIAIHCHQTTGGQYIDAGFAQVIEQE